VAKEKSSCVPPGAQARLVFVAQRAQPVRGMRDIGPPEAELRRRVAARILDVYARFGYEVIETPALEDLEVLVGSGGGENEKLIFKVLKRGARLDEELREGGQLADTGLRFDLTVPLARFVTNHLNDLTMPFKVAHIAPVWRAERPQRGRYREFTQCDIDIVGEPGIAAEVELCGATIEALQSVGINGSTVRLNDRRLLRATVERYLGQLDGPEVVYIALDKLDKVGPADVAAELARAGFEASAVAQLLDRLAVGEMDGEGTVEAALGETLTALQAQGVPARFDPTLVRGLGYYTGQIFEIYHPDVPYSLGGGGRYDGMTARFGAPALPMCGFSIGFERVCDMVDRDLFVSEGLKMAVTCASEDELLRCLARASARRESEPFLTINVVRRARNARKQQEDLRKLGYSEIVDGESFAK
jgi:histidyl-tRNA synthetase